jgi:hypothetical protein
MAGLFHRLAEEDWRVCDRECERYQAHEARYKILCEWNKFDIGGERWEGI